MSRAITARADPEAVRAYWNMSRGDSERAFRAARRHSRFVRFLRVALPVAVVLIMTGMALVTWFNPLRMLAALPVNVNDLVVSGTKITMEQPRVNGFTKDQRAYEFTAEAAAQDLTKPDIVELRNINAKVEMEDKSTMNMKAATGVYDTKHEMLKLEGNILLTSTNGNTGKLSEAMINLQKAERDKNKTAVTEYLEECQNISQQINNLKKV